MSEENSRTCGTCVACCVYLSINDKVFFKEGLAPCPKLRGPKPVAPLKDEGRGDRGAFAGMPLFEREHLRAEGEDNCTMQEHKPPSCAGYGCAWLQGYGGSDDRPDRCGVLIDDVSQPGPIHNALVAKPLWFGAEDEEDGRRAMEVVSREADVPVLVLQFTEFKLRRVVGRGAE